MLKRSTIQLLRFPFSLFLLPVFLFAVSQVSKIDPGATFLIFFILHVLVYPASNGYNSYMDKDTSSIGALKNPPPPSKELFWLTVTMDTLAVLLSFIVSIWFATGVVLYILASRAYSYRGIRLKRFPVIGYLTVIIFQGGVTFCMVYHGSSANRTTEIPVLPAIASCLLIGGFYPLTQVYQHDADLKDGVKTISWLVGYKGTFVLCAIVYSAAMALLALYFEHKGEIIKFFILTTILIPVLVYFFIWAAKVWKNDSAANFNNTMGMNVVASICTTIAFAVLLSWRLFE